VSVFAHLAAVACAETPFHSRAPGNIWVRVRVSFTTGAVRSAILATAGLLVVNWGPVCLPCRFGVYLLYLVLELTVQLIVINDWSPR